MQSPAIYSMRPLALYLILLLGGLSLTGIGGCGRDPNVEGAKLNFRDKAYDAALANIDAALIRDPDNAEAFDLKGQILESKAFDTPEARAHLAIIEEMVEAYQQASTLDPNLTASIENRLSLVFFKEFELGEATVLRDTKEAYGEAALYFRGASLIRPDSTEAYLQQGHALVSAGKTREAIVPFEVALARGESSEDVFLFLSNLYHLDNRPLEAVQVLEAAQAQHPQNVDIQAQLLNAYVDADQIDRAVSVYEQLVAQDPGNKLYHYNLGSLLLEVGGYEEAITHLRHAVEIDPAYTNAQYNLGAAYLNQGVTINEELGALEGALRAQRAGMSRAEIARRQAEIATLADQKRALFVQAIPYLERARTLAEAAEGETAGICLALFQAYAQTGLNEKAEAIAACAGIDLN